MERLSVGRARAREVGASVCVWNALRASVHLDGHGRRRADGGLIRGLQAHGGHGRVDGVVGWPVRRGEHS